MEPRELAQLCVDAITEKQGAEITVLDVEALVGYASYFVVCSAKSGRQVHAIADYIVRHLRTAYGARPLGSEGQGAQTKWVLVDYGDVVVHVFREDERAFYDLEGLWQDAPRVELEGTEPAEKKATEQKTG